MMSSSTRAASWLLVVALTAGCASTAPPPETPTAGGSPGDPARPRVEVTTEPALRAPEPLPAPPTVPAPPATGPDTGAAAPGPPGPGIPPAVAPSPPAAEAPPAPSPTSRPPARQLVLNFDNADVEVVIQAAAEIVGFNYVLAPAARGRKVTVQTVGKISSDEVFPVLLTILDVNGLAAVRSGNLYRIILRENAPQTSVKTIVGREVSAGLPADEVVTQVVPLQFIGAQDAIALLRPFVPAQGALAAHRETNLLIVTDSAANVRRLLEVLNLVDVEVALSELQIIALKHADAQELAQLLAQLFASGRVGAAPGVPASPGPPAAPPAGASPPPPVAGVLAGDRPLIVPERRSNSLVVQEARRGSLRGPAGLHLLRGEHQGPRPRHHPRRHLRTRGSRPGHHRLPAISARLDEHLRPRRLLREPDALALRSAADPVGPAAPAPARGGAAGGRADPLPRLLRRGAPLAVEIRFVADEVTNAVIVTTYPRLWKEMEETIRKLDKMPRQVLIEVLAAEVTLTDDTKLGVEWAVRSGRFAVSSSPSGLLPSRPASSLIPLGGAVPVGFNVFAFAADKFLAALNALASENRVNVLSNPSIMTAENRKAVINVSTSVPIVTSQQVPVAAGGFTGNSITQTVEYRDAGIILTVIPRIGEQGTVALDVKQEVNEVGENEPPPINSPRFTKREAETSVVLLNNQTLVLGGLIQNKRTRIHIGVPWLSRIPILGYLFGSVENKIEKTELLLLITPRTVGTALDAARITDQMRRVTPELEDSMRQAPRRLPPTAPALPPPPPATP